MKGNNMKRHILIFKTVLATAITVQAAPNSWTNTAATGRWEVGANWSLGVPPTNSQSGIVFKPHPGPEVDLRVPSIEKAQALLGYQPKSSLEAGISRTIPWYAEHLSVTQR